MNCPECGKSNPENSNFCVHCGAPFSMEPPPPPPPSYPAGGSFGPGQQDFSQGYGPGTQGQGYLGAPPPNPATMGYNIPDYLPFAIFITLCCCLPMGIAAIVFSSQVKTKLAIGDYLGAEESAKNAKLWAWLGFGFGLFVQTIYIIIAIAAEM